MNKTNSNLSPPQISLPQIVPPQLPIPVSSDFTEEPFVTAEQASAALNLPLYYFINTRKRASLGIPYYAINRMVRYRIRELHQWQVRYAAQTGGTHA